VKIFFFIFLFAKKKMNEDGSISRRYLQKFSS